MADQEVVPRRIGEGDVEITLGDENLVLRPNYNAARTISQQYGGISNAIDRIVRLDVDAVVNVIQLGLGYTSTKKPPKDLPEKIWQAGLTDDTGRLGELCISYLRVLASGGRKPKSQGDGDTGDDQEQRDPPQ